MRETEDPPKTAHEIDLEILRLAQAQGALEAELGRWILLAYQARVHRTLGLASFAKYLELRLGYGPRLAHDKVTVLEALEQLPLLKQALRSGARSWSAARELVRVASTGTEAEWLSATEGKTVREVERQVAGHRPGDRPNAAPDPLLVQHRRTVTLTSDQRATLRDAEVQARRILGAQVTDGEIWAAIAEGFLGRGRRLEEEAGYQISLTICAECHRSWRPVGGESIEVSEAVHDCACCDGELVGLTPESAEPVLGAIPEAEPPRCGDEPVDLSPDPAASAVAISREPEHAAGVPIASPGSLATSGLSQEGAAATLVGHPVSKARPDVRCLQGAVVTALPRFAIHGIRPLQGPGRLAPPAAVRPTSRIGALTHVGGANPTEVLRELIGRGGIRAVLHETSNALGFRLQTVSPRLRKMVLARDHHRCSVPGCGNAVWVDLHHLQRVADGGPNHPDNLVTLCNVHHAQHHAGSLGIEGTPSTGLIFYTPRGILYGGGVERMAA